MKPSICILLFCLFGYCLPAHSQTVTKPGRSVLRSINTVNKDLRMSFGGGYAYRMGKLAKTGDTKLDNIAKNLRHGFNLDFDAQYYFKRDWGLGLSVNYARASASGKDVYLPNIGSASNFKEINNFTYFGPTFSYRYNLDDFLFVINFGFGPLFFNSKDVINNGQKTLNLNKTTFAMQLNINAEYPISDNAGIGLKVGTIAGSVPISGMNERFSVSNLGISAFLSFRSWE